MQRLVIDQCVVLCHHNDGVASPRPLCRCIWGLQLNGAPIMVLINRYMALRQARTFKLLTYYGSASHCVHALQSQKMRRGIWGPHLIVVPTSVMLNWEMECKKWAPAFKLLTYYGSAKERAAKRNGWTKPNAFHICITSYAVILQARLCPGL